MSLAVSIAVVLAAYLMGGCMPGYWFVRWRTGRDVRDQGSGGTGIVTPVRVADGWQATRDIVLGRGISGYPGCTP